MTNPIFLVGSRRSGTTLFRLMMNGHKDITWHRGWESTADAIAHFGSDGADPLELKLDKFDTIAATDLVDLTDKVNQNITQSLKKDGKDVFGATTHIGFKQLKVAWPHAKFIHLIRDPRDIAVSHVKLGWSGHYYFAADAWKTAENDWDELKELLDDDQFMELRYEDFVSEPESELKKVCDFIGVEYSEDLFSYIETSKYSYPKKELTYRWKDKLSSQEAQLCESSIYEMMQQRGYEPTAARKQYSDTEVRSFKLKDTWLKRKFRVAEKGLGLFVVDKLARDTKLPPLVKVRDKMERKKRVEHLAALEKNY